MAQYPGEEDERRYPEAALRETVAGVFERCGMSAADARLLSDSLVHADLRGIHFV